MLSEQDAGNDATTKSDNASTEEKKNRATSRNMSAFISFLFGTFIFVITFAFVVGHLFQGTYEGYVRAMYWGVPAFLSAGIAIFCGYYSFVIEPSRTKDLQPPADRPWLNVELIPAGPIIYLPQQPGMCAFFPVKFRITNTGHSPSSEIQLKADVFFGRFQKDPREQQRTIASWKGQPFRPGVVFPAIPEEHTITWVKPISEMKEAGIDPGAPTSEQVKHFDAYIGGCISYTYGANFHGETGFLYKVLVDSGGNPAASIVPEIGKEIALERLAFRRYFPGGGEWAK